MISREDCIAMCGLDADEVAAIAEHEHMADITAAALGADLLHRPGGTEDIRKMFIEDIRTAIKGGRTKHAAELLMVLRRFLEQHPEIQSGRTSA
jgi:hypothetical protein